MGVALDQALMDEIIQFQLDLRRFEAGTRQNVLSILKRMQNELVVALSHGEQMTTWTKARKAELLRQVNAVINQSYATAQGELALSSESVASLQVKHMADVLAATAVVDVGVVMPTQAVLARLADSVLIEGGPIADWWQKLAIETSFKVNNAIRQGIVQNETNAQIIARIVGKHGEPGIMEITRKNAAALVQTATQTVANDARLKTFEANADVVTRLTWFSAMDGHVCPRCIALSGKTWTNNADGTHAPLGHGVPFQNPPIHWNDRCVMLPGTKTFREMGINIDEAPMGQRASSKGPIAANTTFDDYLSRQSVAAQDAQLGKGRAQLFRDRKITLGQLIDGKGNELSLADLQAKYATAEVMSSISSKAFGQTGNLKEIKKAVYAIAQQENFPLEKIVFSGEKLEFLVNDEPFDLAGEASMDTGVITIYFNQIKTYFAPKLAAHEIAHVHYESVLNAYFAELQDAIKDERGHAFSKRRHSTGVFQNDGALFPEFAADYPITSRLQAYFTPARVQELVEMDGVTDYSVLWWQEYKAGRVPLRKAMHETVAEIAGERAGIWVEEPHFTPIWREFTAALRTIYMDLP